MLIIGEKLNSTIPKVQEALNNKDKDYIQELAKKQVEAGADYIDVNTAMGNEADDMQWIVECINEVVDTPLCIDSTNPVVIKRGLEVNKFQSMINSISMEKKRLEGILPLAAEYNCPVIALTTNDQGIPKTVEERLKITEKLVDILVKNNYDLNNLYVDPLVLPLAVDSNNAVLFFESLAVIKQKFHVKIVSGLSNASHSLPNRRIINRYFLAVCMSVGMDAAILDPLDRKIMTAVTATNLLVGNDRLARNYLKAHRKGVLEN